MLCSVGKYTDDDDDDDDEEEEEEEDDDDDHIPPLHDRVSWSDETIINYKDKVTRPTRHANIQIINTPSVADSILRQISPVHSPLGSSHKAHS